MVMRISCLWLHVGPSRIFYSKAKGLHLLLTGGRIAAVSITAMTYDPTHARFYTI